MQDVNPDLLNPESLYDPKLATLLDSSFGLQRYAFEAKPPSTCFPKGTLVHTENGLVPIEKIKVGDRVLSKHESGEGEQAYKPVTKVFEHEPTKVVQVWYVEAAEKPTYGGFVFTTLEHPFWVEGAGWTEARCLVGRPELAKIQLLNSEHVNVQGVSHVLETSSLGIGWTSRLGNIIDELGDEWDIEANLLHRQGVYAEEDFTYYDNPLKLPVWNLEVEDFHTYYVGKDGLWVHNKNADTTITATINRSLLKIRGLDLALRHPFLPPKSTTSARK